MRRLNWFRFTLALVCTLGLVATGVLAFMMGSSLTSVQVGLLTLVIAQLGSGKGVAFGWFYDGAADSPPASTTTTISTPDPSKPATLVTTEVKPAAAPAAAAPSSAPAPSAPLAAYPIDLPQDAYDRLVKDGWTDAELIAANMNPPKKVTP
jgi:hypothetical protein